MHDQNESHAEGEAQSGADSLSGFVGATEVVRLSERDSLLLLDMLEYPPEPTARLILAARAGFVLVPPPTK